jgi:hypothetical protein
VIDEIPGRLRGLGSSVCARLATGRYGSQLLTLEFAAGVAQKLRVASSLPASTPLIPTKLNDSTGGERAMLTKPPRVSNGQRRGLPRMQHRSSAVWRTANLAPHWLLPRPQPGSSTPQPPLPRRVLVQYLECLGVALRKHDCCRLCRSRRIANNLEQVPQYSQSPADRPANSQRKAIAFTAIANDCIPCRACRCRRESRRGQCAAVRGPG